MKRSFTGQMMLIIFLIFLTLTILSAATQLLYYRSTLKLMQEDLSASATASAGFVRIYEADNRQNRQQLRFQLSYTALAAGNDIVVLDENGTVTSCSCGLQSCEHLGRQVAPEVWQKTDPEHGVFEAGAALGCYEEKRMYAVVCAETDSGARAYVLASRPSSVIRDLMGEATRANLIVIVMVMAFSVPLVGFIIQRQMRPIKQMTAAARKMAHGQMDVRVSVNETDTAELSDLSVAFNNMAEALAKSERKRQEFVANVSHELKTPMTTISGYMEGMLDGTIPPEQHRKYMTIISGEVKRLSRLVRNMLEISRIQDQGIPAERRKPFDLCQTMGEVLLSFEQKINEKHLEVETDLPDLGARTSADPDAIQQVIYNLIENAVKFCPEGGTLSMGISETKNEKYLVAIRNTGPTIPPEELSLIFDRFHKTDKSRSVDRTGVGLGLYIVKTIILSHEEDIYVTSRDGVTEFSFTMPKLAPQNGVQSI